MSDDRSDEEVASGPPRPARPDDPGQKGGGVRPVDGGEAGTDPADEGGTGEEQAAINREDDPPA